MDSFQNPFVSFLLTKNVNQNHNRYKETVVKIYEKKQNKQFSQYGRNWVLTFDMNNFEEIHGMSRVVKLIPDKFVTALAINKENLQNAEDDGSFLIHLIIKLIRQYIQIHEKNLRLWRKPEEELSQTTSGYFIFQDFEKKLNKNEEKQWKGLLHRLKTFIMFFAVIF